MIVAVPVDTTGQIEPGWGRAQRVAVGAVDSGELTAWQVHEVGWGDLHDTGTEGAHHARMVRFLRDQQVEAVVVERMGAGMKQVMTSMHITITSGAAGDARAAMIAAAG